MANSTFTTEYQQREETDVHLHIGSRTVLRILMLIALFGLFAAAVLELAPLILQLLVAAFVAVALDTVVRSLQQRGLGRGKAVAVVMLGLVLAVALMAAIFVPPLVDGGDKLIENRATYIEDIRDSGLYRSIDERFDVGGNVADKAQDAVGEIPSQLGNAFGSIIGGIFSFITFLFLVLFLLTGGGSVLHSSLRLFPQLTERMWWEVIRGAYRNIGSYVVGALGMGLIAGVSMSAVLLALGNDYALPLGLWMMLFDLIPLVGASIGAVPAVLVTFLTEGTVDGIIVLIFVVIYQQIENVYIQPKIQGRAASLSPLTIFVAVLVGSNLLGVVGALFAVPVASVLAIIYHQYLQITGRDQIELPTLFDETDHLKPADPDGEAPGAAPA
jgi:predicted PurR-regulated permease PerM